MRPIDADALLQRIENWDRQLRSYTHYTDRIVCNVLCGVVDEIEDMDTLDYAPVKRGEWVTKPDGFIPADIYCSECGKRYNFFYNPNYCPNCGAKMDGGKEDAHDS